jgi:acetyltransferase-like isoleucine patch superfamily enzyme
LQRPTEKIIAEAPPQCDPSVILGYPAERSPGSCILRIGAGARLRSGTVIYVGVTIGRNLATGHNVVIREDTCLGDDVSIWSNSVIDYGCRVGNRVKIHCNVYIPQFTTIEDDVFIAPGCTFANDNHPGCECSDESMKGPLLKTGARVGVNATVVPGVTIGEYALIGSGSVVTRDVPPHTVVAGSPARVMKRTNELRCASGRAAYRNDPNPGSLP